MSVAAALMQPVEVSGLYMLQNALNGVQTDNYQLPLFTKDKRRVELLLNAATRRGPPCGPSSAFRLLKLPSTSGGSR